MKKQLGLIIGTALLSSMAFAQGTLKCTITTSVADKGGYLMPGTKTTTIEAPLMNADTLRMGLDLYLKSCTKGKLENLELRLCTMRTEFKGIYEAGLTVGNGNKEQSTGAYVTLATKVDGSGLGIMSGADAVSPSLIEKLVAADIEVPHEMRGDSLQIDEALGQAAKKNLITDGEIAVIAIDKCELK